jgi:hypothetical protein
MFSCVLFSPFYSQLQIKEKKSGSELEPYIDFFILPVEESLNNLVS